jgi:ABC-type glutathione transport system ATPase component
VVHPRRCPHPDNAHLFLNYLLRPEVIAAISNETRYAAPNRKARPYLLPEVRDDPAVYRPTRSGTRCARDTCTARRKNASDRGSGRASRQACNRTVNSNGNGGATATHAPGRGQARTAAGSPLVQIQEITKRFDGLTAVERVSLDIHRGELFAILGASGCGKTTLLRMLAGFEEPTSGGIVIDGVDMTDVPPYERPVNLMFQSYALFPHMTVEQNVAYGLKKERVPRSRSRNAWPRCSRS